MAKKKKGIWETMETKAVEKKAKASIKDNSPDKKEEENFVRIRAYEETRYLLKIIAVKKRLSMQDALKQIVEAEHKKIMEQ